MMAQVLFSDTFFEKDWYLNTVELLGQVLLNIYIAVYFMFEITYIFYHFSTIRFPFETLGI